VPSFQRFDLDGTTNHTIITDREMKRRWASFHGEMHSLSGTWLQRTIGRLLGENTWRYRLARIIGRPVLRTVRKVRKIPPKIEIDRERAARANAATKVFPANYEPRFALRYVDDATTIPRVDDSLTMTTATSSTMSRRRRLPQSSTRSTKRSPRPPRRGCSLWTSSETVQTA
jgi:hypothetical protein